MSEESQGAKVIDLIMDAVDENIDAYYSLGSRDFVVGEVSSIVAAALGEMDAEIAGIRADAKRMRWLLSGNGYFMEENFLFGRGPCSQIEQDAARAEIDAAMAETSPAPK